MLHSFRGKGTAHIGTYVVVVALCSKEALLENGCLQKLKKHNYLVCEHVYCIFAESTSSPVFKLLQQQICCFLRSNSEWRWVWPVCWVKCRHSNGKYKRKFSTLLCLIFFPISSNSYWLIVHLVTLMPMYSWEIIPQCLSRAAERGCYIMPIKSGAAVFDLIFQCSFCMCVCTCVWCLTCSVNLGLNHIGWEY